MAALLAGELTYSHESIAEAVRQELADLRGLPVKERPWFSMAVADPIQVAGRVAERLGRDLRPRLCPVINATGIVLHTNLGRAPIAEEAAQAAGEAAPRLPEP